MDMETVIGIIASVFTGVALLPQLIKILKEKKSEGVSYGMLASLFIGLSFWIWYGIMKQDFIIIVSNCFSLIVNLLIVFLSVKYNPETK
ncbi:MAG: hypothetical protein JWO32_2303 [Bacteroidetes bacterium]|nr:hypothetical protein [Bacteroidota bacterium]